MEASKGKEVADDGTAAKQRMLNIEKLKIRPAIILHYRLLAPLLNLLHLKGHRGTCLCAFVGASFSFVGWA